jgi:hypothetical protein
VAFEKKVTSQANEFLTYIRLEKGLYEVKISNNKEKASIIVAVGDIYTIIGHSFTGGWGLTTATMNVLLLLSCFNKDMTNFDFYRNTGFISMKDFSETHSH